MSLRRLRSLSSSIFREMPHWPPYGHEDEEASGQGGGLVVVARPFCANRALGDLEEDFRTKWIEVGECP